jgi:CsoR family transcriptional regulator, copper-sensing transcriptional repressor
MTTYGYAQEREEYLKRLRRIEGQVRGLQRMVEEDRYCIDVLTQVASVTKALQGVAMGLLDEHLRHCVADAVKADGGEEKLNEAMNAVERLLRT